MPADSGGQILRGLGVAHLGQQDGELIAAETRHQVVWPHGVPSAG